MKKLFLLAVPLLLLPFTAAADSVTADDVIVQGSLCVGVDCTSGLTFGFDTVRLRENNLRIHFEDTSTSASFPSNDWMLVANDSNNGGANHFSIDDVTGQSRPFSIVKGAPHGALTLTAQGVGFGTSAPARSLHSRVDDTPTLRLEQTAAAGWPAYGWDVGGNESSFFVRDTVTGTLPLRVQPGADDDTLVVAASGNVGVGTANPLARLHLKGDGAVVLYHEDAAGSSTWEEAFGPDPVVTGGRAWTLTELGGAPAIRVTHDGNVDIPGTLSQGSSRATKHRFLPVDPNEILEKVSALGLSRWQYQKDTSNSEHLGPMAEDFFATFGLGHDDKHLAPADLAGVAVASVQALHQKVQEQEQEIARLKKESDEREERLARLEAMLRAR